MNLRIRIYTAAVAAAILLTAGCAKKPEETAVSSTSETVTEPVTETTSGSPDNPEETPFEPVAEYGKGAFSCKAGNVIFRNSVNCDTAIFGYEGVKGLDSGWHGDKWIDITTWLTDLHSYQIDDKYLKGGSADVRYHVVNGTNGFVISFVPVREIGKKNYDGFDTPAEVPVTLVNIEVTLESGFKIVIADSGEDKEYNISGSGRGWYMTHDQIVAAEYLFEKLEKDGSKDPLSDIIDHKTLNNTNTYTF